MVENTNGPRHPLEPIARKFEHFAESHEPEKGVASADDPGSPPAQPEAQRRLLLHSISSPAMLMDRRARIIWQNTAAVARIWQNAPIATDQEEPSVFNILLDAEYQKEAENWREWALFFTQQALAMAGPENWNELKKQFDSRQSELLADLSFELVSADDRSENRILQVRRGVAGPLFATAAADCDEGRLLIFEPLMPPSGRELEKQNAASQILMSLRQVPSPHKQIIHVLSARLNQAETLRVEMLEEEYADLLNRLWHLCREVVGNHGGIMGRFTGDGFRAYFLPAGGPDKDRPEEVVACALKLKCRMAEFSREWKMRKGWLYEMMLNIGLHGGRESVGLLPSALGEDLYSCGDIPQASAVLSEAAREGRVMATKALLNRLAPDELKKLRFGIFRRENEHTFFISRFFSRLGDLITAAAVPMELPEPYRSLTVTEIFDRTEAGS